MNILEVVGRHFLFSWSSGAYDADYGIGRVAREGFEVLVLDGTMSTVKVKGLGDWGRELTPMPREAPTMTHVSISLNTEV